MSKTRKPGNSEMPSETVDIEGEAAESSYTVGYGKPPAHSRFKPGQSGNPKGKPKGRRSYRKIVAAILNEKIAVNTPRGRKRMTKLEALIQTNMNQALKGDSKATDHILKIAREYGMGDEVAEAIDAGAMNALREEDRTILARHLGEVKPEAGE